MAAEFGGAEIQICVRGKEKNPFLRGKSLVDIADFNVGPKGPTLACLAPDESRGSMTKRYCLTLDLKDDPKLIAEYRRYHEKIWPEITKSIRDAGIRDMEIYLLGTRLFMVMEVDETFSFEKKAKADAANRKAREWEDLMWKFQKPLPGAEPGEKWVRMERIFKLE